jgi:glutamine cyclotransferase
MLRSMTALRWWQMVTLSCLICVGAAWGWSSATLPAVTVLRIVHRYAHDHNAFTEGLTIHHERNERADRNDNSTVYIYESTGLWGRSSLRLWYV